MLTNKHLGDFGEGEGYGLLLGVLWHPEPDAEDEVSGVIRECFFAACEE